ncbi:MAG: hypothetical protein OHK0052_04450 [Anaerolineales bacterium]
MKKPTEQQMPQLRAAFKQLNNIMLWQFRLGLGQFLTLPTPAGMIMVIEHTGRKSGLLRYVPVNYAPAPDNRSVYCLSGFGKSEWYRNLLHHPQTAVWIGNRRIYGRAETLDSLQHLSIYRQVLINSGFATLAFEGFDPRTAPESRIREMTEKAPLLRIVLNDEVTPNAPHPGDYAWVWSLAAVGLLALLLRRRK